MDHFRYHDGCLRCEDVPARRLARRYGTPLYVYSRAALSARYQRLRAAFAEVDPAVRFSVKSCPNIHICRLLRELGSGFDVVSGGELYRVLQAGAAAEDVVFAGVGKTARELREALQAGVGWLVVESPAELELIADLACQLARTARVLVRVNPDVDAGTHAYTTTGRRGSKFGIDADQVLAVCRQFGKQRWLHLGGLHVHIGSPVLDLQSYRRGIERAVDLLSRLRTAGWPADTLDIGGGFAADYGDQAVPAVEQYAAAVLPCLRDAQVRVIVEPGRYLTAEAGVLLTRVLRIKPAGGRRLAVVDASMNELIRPALYDAYHFLWPAEASGCAPVGRQAPPGAALLEHDVAGPLCESSDYLARGRALPELQAGDLLAVFSVGAYGMSMASQYNSRPRAAEVLVDGATSRLIRRRESYADLLAAELGL